MPAKKTSPGNNLNDPKRGGQNAVTFVDRTIPSQIKLFENHYMDFFEINGEYFISAKSLADGLDYKDLDNVSQIFRSHKKVIEPYSQMLRLTTDGGVQEMRVFNRMGALAIILFSKSPRAVKFQKWVLEVLDEINRTGAYLSPAVIPQIEATFRSLIAAEMATLRAALPPPPKSPFEVQAAEDLLLLFALHPEKMYTIDDLLRMHAFQNTTPAEMQRWVDHWRSLLYIREVHAGVYVFCPPLSTCYDIMCYPSPALQQALKYARQKEAQK